MPEEAFFVLSIGGNDITAKVDPYLISLDVSLHEESQSDTCNVTLDDKDGQIILPPKGAPLVATLGWGKSPGAVVFQGTIDEPKSSGSRSGRLLTVSAKALNTTDKSKQPQQLHMDKTDAQGALNKAGALSGHTVQVDPSLNVTREWWGMNDESFIHFGQRIAGELGGVFRMRGRQAILADKTGGSISGLSLAMVKAVWGDNLISWDLSPSMGRPQFTLIGARWYDLAGAKWMRETANVTGTDGDVQAEHNDRFSRADQGEAQGKAKNHAKDSEKEKGGGSIAIDGNAGAVPGGTCVLIGARAGVDGAWRISEVQHQFSRSGWTTSMSVKMPPQGS